MNDFDMERNYRSVVSSFSTGRQPIIGITGNFGDKGCELAEGYFRSIELAGGIPMVIPPLQDTTQFTALLERIDGLLLSGGSDVNPLFTGEDPVPALGSINPQRDAFELLLTRLAYDRNIPILGICRGIQVLCLALGGKVHQDLPTCLPEVRLLKHSQNAPRHVATHRVQAEKDSLIAALLGEEFAVNSFHHQAVSECGEWLRPVAFSADGVIEAVESTDFKSVYGVQWHPECFVLGGDESMLPLFRHFVADCASYGEAREIHRNVLTLDSHCDTPMCFARGAKLTSRETDVCVDLHKMHEGGLDAAIMAAYLPQRERTDDALKGAVEQCHTILESVRQQVADHPAACLASTPASLYEAKQAGKHAFMLGIENGYAIGRDLDNIAQYCREGVVYMTLCHNGDNDICDAAMRSQREHGGLSDFGRQVVLEMNRCGMMIDLSHASEETFFDVLQFSAQPVVCSHSSSRVLCDHPRNVTDEQIRQIAEKGGVVQVTFYPHFLKESGDATIEDVVRHILHVWKVGGIDAVGIGSDFDGDGGVRGLRTASDFINLTRRLLAEGFTREQLQKIWGGNFLRVMSQVQRTRSLTPMLSNE